MEDYSIIQGQTILELMIALLLTVVTSYVYLSCRAYAQRMNATRPDRLKALCRLSTDENRESFSALPHRTPAETGALQAAPFVVRSPCSMTLGSMRTTR